MKPRVVLVWLAVCLLWSSTFAFHQAWAQDLPPFTFAWLRLAIAVAVLAPIAIAGGHWRSLSRRDVAAVCGHRVLLLGVNYGLVFWGAQFVPSGLVAILLSGTPVLALAFGWFLGSEAVTPRKLSRSSSGSWASPSSLAPRLAHRAGRASRRCCGLRRFRLRRTRLCLAEDLRTPSVADGRDRPAVAGRPAAAAVPWACRSKGVRRRRAGR